MIDLFRRRVREEVLLSEANVLCIRLREMARAAMRAKDRERFNRVVSIQVKAIRRWRRRKNAPILGKPL